MNPHILVFDGNNMLHRARSGFTAGEFAVVFNFFRSFRAEIERHVPSRVVFTLDGSPKRQLRLDPDYKANRRHEETDPKKLESFRSFLKQKLLITHLLKETFPVSVMQHDDFEADDLIFNVVKRATRLVPFTIVSTDTDFTQLLEIENVNVYNPVKKKFLDKLSYDYVAWKALRGDKTDNVPGIVGDKTAVKLLETFDLFTLMTLKGPLDHAKGEIERFTKNVNLIKFKQFTDEETYNVQSWQGTRDWDRVKREFESYQFKSIVNDFSWKKFVETFDPLFGDIK